MDPSPTSQSISARPRMASRPRHWKAPVLSELWSRSVCAGTCAAVLMKHNTLYTKHNLFIKRKISLLCEKRRFTFHVFVSAPNRTSELESVWPRMAVCGVAHRCSGNMSVEGGGKFIWVKKKKWLVLDENAESVEGTCLRKHKMQFRLIKHEQYHASRRRKTSCANTTESMTEDEKNIQKFIQFVKFIQAVLAVYRDEYPAADGLTFHDLIKLMRRNFYLFYFGFQGNSCFSTRNV